MSSFTPCFNFITGSTNGGGSPTAECCDAFSSLVTSSAECTCLIVTGNVPFSIPFINNALAITLPRLCNSKSVPLQCKATATPLPGAGPVAYAPGLPPLPPFGSDGLSPTGSPSLRASPPALADSPVISHEGRRPSMLPNSAMKISHLSSFALLPILVLGILI